MTLLLGIGDSEATCHGSLRTPGIVAGARRVCGGTSSLPEEDPASIRSLRDVRPFVRLLRERPLLVREGSVTEPSRALEAPRACTY